MNVAEYIELLKTFDRDLEVVRISYGQDGIVEDYDIIDTPPEIVAYSYYEVNSLNGKIKYIASMKDALLIG